MELLLDNRIFISIVLSIVIRYARINFRPVYSYTLKYTMYIRSKNIMKNTKL